jgi:hypothetical protein
MKQIALVALMSGALFVSPSFADSARRRQVNQQARIGHNVATGQLTPREARRLERQEAALHREIVRDRIDGGRLSMRERAKINARQNALSREIRRQSNDGQHR